MRQTYIYQRDSFVSSSNRTDSFDLQSLRSLFFASSSFALFFCIVSAALLSGAPVHSQQTSEDELEPRTRNPNQMRVTGDAADRGPRRSAIPRGRAAVFPNDFRSIDGSGNNTSNPAWGSTGTTFLRLAGDAYAGNGAPGVAGRISAREISNLCVADPGDDLPAPPISDFFWQWGQFLDHDLDLTPEVEPVEAFDIQVPSGDPWFDPGNTGTQTIHFGRSAYDISSGVREQLNLITAYIDASNVYGSDPERAAALRTLDGTGKLLTSVGGLLPFNEEGFDNAGGTDDSLFLAGDFRANEQVGLTTMHTLFVREHNWLVDNRIDITDLNGDEIYEAARAIVAAEMQSITYRVFLPILLGDNALPDYEGYDPEVDATISNEFATAAYRFGHSMVSPVLLRLDAEGEEIADGNLTLDQAFFRPDHVIRGGIEPVLRGLEAQRAQRLDNVIIDELRNLLFGPPGSGGLDLAALNIQRGRDHGLADFGSVRRSLGLNPIQRFEDVGRDRDAQDGLAEAYENVAQIDLWVGGLAEAPVDGGLVGETFRAVLADQFTRLRDGDRFWYRSYLPRRLTDWVDNQSLADIIRRNTDIGDEIRDDVFRLNTPGAGRGNGPGN